MTLQQLEFFRAVARNLSFSNAARELYTSQPYVSNQIRRLEEHFRVPLFVRSHPRIALTEAGEVLFARATEILDDVEQLEQLVQQFQGLRRGTVNLGATASAGNHVLPELIAGFHATYPEIVIRTRIGNTDDVLEWLDLDESEVGVSPLRPGGRNLVSEPFYREPLVVIHPATMRLPDPLPLDRLATLPKIAREEGSQTLARMLELTERFDNRTEFVAQFSGTTAVNEAVAEGMGVSLVPERSARAWLEAGSVRAVSLDCPALYHDFFVIYNQRRYLTPAAGVLIEHLRRHPLA